MRIVTWQCADGRRIPIGAMELSHLHNCIAKIQRHRGCWRAQWLEPLCAELERRSHGQLHVERLTRREQPFAWLLSRLTPRNSELEQL